MNHVPNRVCRVVIVAFSAIHLLKAGPSPLRMAPPICSTSSSAFSSFLGLITFGQATQQRHQHLATSPSQSDPGALMEGVATSMKEAPFSNSRAACVVDLSSALTTFRHPAPPSEAEREDTTRPSQSLLPEALWCSSGHRSLFSSYVIGEFHYHQKMRSLPCEKEVIWGAGKKTTARAGRIYVRVTPKKGHLGCRR